MTPGNHSRRRAIALSASLAAGGLAPLAFVGAGGADVVVLLVWLAIVAFPAGWLAGGWRLPPWVAPVVGAVWLGGVLLAQASGPRTDSPHWAWAWMVWTGLMAAGFAAGTSARGRPGRGAAASLLVTAALTGLPGGAGLGHLPRWSPSAAARLLDLSPATLLVESAGIDWMRHPAVYAPAGADSIGPDLRLPWRGELAGPVVLLVGCALAFTALRSAASRRQE